MYEWYVYIPYQLQYITVPNVYCVHVYVNYSTQLYAMLIVYMYISAAMHNFIQCLLCTCTCQLRYTTSHNVHCVHVHVSYNSTMFIVICSKTQILIMFIEYIANTHTY